MICPECGYIDEVYDDGVCTREGKYGDFFKLPVELKREVSEYSRQTERADLYGCPKCKKLFLGD
jgi:hypothetical protein